MSNSPDIITPDIQFDSPWKTAIETYFPDFMAFFFPQIYADIDWSRGFEFLDQELQQVVRDAELGKRLADKLVRVWRLSGEETWVLIHIEVQSAEQAEFSFRMYVYNYRLSDKYNVPRFGDCTNKVTNGRMFSTCTDLSIGCWSCRKVWS
jgi:hypothetical protein